MGKIEWLRYFFWMTSEGLRGVSDCFPQCVGPVTPHFLRGILSSLRFPPKLLTHILRVWCWAFLDLTKRCEWKVLDGNQDSFFFPKWTLTGLLAEICRGCLCPVRTHVSHWCNPSTSLCKCWLWQPHHTRHVASGSYRTRLNFRDANGKVAMLKLKKYVHWLATLRSLGEADISSRLTVFLSLSLCLSFPQLCSLGVTLPLAL